MFDVLVYLYETYWRPDACPEPAQLQRKLSAVGFEQDEIKEALHWLDGLTAARHTVHDPVQSSSVRVYTAQEWSHLGSACIDFISFLSSAGVLRPAMRELVLERALALEVQPVPLEDLKIMVLMVFWCLGEEPDALILDELFVDTEDRQIH
ncbi:DUF494 family protein [Inhella gelatinilytica]|uniref:Protein Smg homolog n=1 Tax=Inhella gelatinilytica TaxID=2795030 RepID=A0A931NE99_9BURK|nr:DUF494 domain-containing protein [Inhella gelatinilytica]MBH9553937.1 DUF494 domain-containing protein [Inhella gelatinilytica]